jgi:hypothetical protein
MNTRTILAWAAGLLLLLMAAQCSAAEPVYKCGSRNGATYTDKPCSGARELGTTPSKRVTRRYDVPPQDRAKAVRRAQLKPEARKECQGLETTMREQQVVLKQKGEAGAPETDSALVKNKLRYHELRC